MEKKMKKARKLVILIYRLTILLYIKKNVTKNGTK